MDNFDFLDQAITNKPGITLSELVACSDGRFTKHTIRSYLVALESEGKINTEQSKNGSMQYHPGQGSITKDVGDHEYCVKVEASGHGTEIVKFGDKWKSRPAQTGRISGCSGRSSIYCGNMDW